MATPVATLEQNVFLSRWVCRYNTDFVTLASARHRSPLRDTSRRLLHLDVVDHTPERHPGDRCRAIRRIGVFFLLAVGSVFLIRPCLTKTCHCAACWCTVHPSDAQQSNRHYQPKHNLTTFALDGQTHTLQVLNEKQTGRRIKMQMHRRVPTQRFSVRCAVCTFLVLRHNHDAMIRSPRRGMIAAGLCEVCASFHAAG